MAGKSILEQALLQVETLEEAVKANAKGILASTMKQELNDLLKEQEDMDPEEEEKDVDGAMTPEDDEETSISDEIPDEETSTEDEEGIPDLDNELGGEELPSDEESDDDVLDMTGASEAEVLKVFKAMKPEDGIVVKKDGNTVQFSDDGNDYIIKLDGEEETEEIPSDDETSEFPDNLAEQEEDTDEIVYEIELDEEEEVEEQNVKMGQPAIKGLGKPVVKEPKEQNTKMGQPAIKGLGKPVVKEPKESDLKGMGKPVVKEPKESDLKGMGKPVVKEPKEQNTKMGQPAIKGLGKPVVKEPKEGDECTECGKVEATEAARTKWNPHGNKADAKRAGIPSKKIFKAGSGVDNLNEEVEILRKQNGEYKKALILFKDKLNEVAVFNANLAYATRLFTEHSTTKQEKLEILKRFDTISTINESKNLYASIKTELDTKKPLSESAVEKIAATPSSSSTEVLSEAKAYENPQFKRMKDLMSKI